MMLLVAGLAAGATMCVIGHDSTWANDATSPTCAGPGPRTNPFSTWAHVPDEACTVPPHVSGATPPGTCDDQALHGATTGTHPAYGCNFSGCLCLLIN